MKTSIKEIQTDGISYEWNKYYKYKRQLSLLNEKQQQLQYIQQHNIRHDLDENKFYLMDNFTQEQQLVNFNGDHIKQFNNEITGKAKYSERIIKSGGNISLLPHEPESLRTRPNFYIPQPDKFEGYMQIPRPRVGTYCNKHPQSANALSTKGAIDYITGTAKDFYLVQKSKKISVLEEGRATKYRQIGEEQGSVKIINGIYIGQPNLNNIRNNSYNRKVKKNNSVYSSSSIVGETQSNTGHQESQNVFDGFLQKKYLDLINLEKSNNREQLIQNRLQQYNIKTLNQNNCLKVESAQNLLIKFRGERDLINEIETQNRAFQQYKINQKKERLTISVKGRFNNVYFQQNK